MRRRLRLAHRGEVAPDDREQRQQRDQISSIGDASCALPKQPHHRQQHAGLDDGRHVGRHRHARALVGVGRPGVERHDRPLEEEGQHDQHDGGARQAVVGRERAREGVDPERAARCRRAARRPSGRSRSRCRRAPGTSAPLRRSAAADRPAAPARRPAATSAPGRGTASGSCPPTAAGRRRRATTAAARRTRRPGTRRAPSAAPAAPARAPSPCRARSEASTENCPANGAAA